MRSFIRPKAVHFEFTKEIEIVFDFAEMRAEGAELDNVMPVGDLDAGTEVDADDLWEPIP